MFSKIGLVLINILISVGLSLILLYLSWELFDFLLSLILKGY